MKKDPNKVKAGRKGGKLSGGNFKHNHDAASHAGKMSAWKRHSGKLADFPIELEDQPLTFPRISKPTRRRKKNARA